VGFVRIADRSAAEAAGLAVTVGDAPDAAASAHRAFGSAAFNGAWELIDLAERTPEQDRNMLMLAFAARWHWGEVGTPENIAISDWQVGHVACLAGETALAMRFAQAAYDAARGEGMPDWLRASTAEGMARASAVAGDSASYEHFADEARRLIATLDDEEDRALIESQLASIPRL
jgi:hypothetical protein